MHVDAYTKGVLTVIALCLVWMCVNGTPQVAHAQATAAKAPMPVVLVDEKGTPLFAAEGLRVNLGRTATPVTVGDATLRVVVENAALPVAVRAIESGARWDPVFVRVLREPPTLMPVP